MRRIYFLLKECNSHVLYISIHSIICLVHVQNYTRAPVRVKSISAAPEKIQVWRNLSLDVKTGWSSLKNKGWFVHFGLERVNQHLTRKTKWNTPPCFWTKTRRKALSSRKTEFTYIQIDAWRHSSGRKKYASRPKLFNLGPMDRTQRI